LNISRRVSKIGISPTMKINAEAKEMQARGEDVIDLSVGEPDFPTPQNIKDAGKQAIDLNQTRYTANAGKLELRLAIARKLKEENGLEYHHNNIIVSTGAKQGLFNAVQCLVHDEDEVIFSSPYYVSYPEMVTLAHGKSVVIPTTEETDFNLTPDQLKEAITPKTKVLILSYPTNPTGSCFTPGELEKLAGVVAENKLYVICDDIYEHLIYDDYKFRSFASFGSEVKGRTVVVNGFSKTYSMTGWRIGYAAGPEEIIKAMNKIQSHSTSNASTISQLAAFEALNGPQDFVETMRKEFELRRDFVYRQITSIPGVTCFKPRGAFYIFPKVISYFGKSTPVLRIENSFDLAMYLLHEAKVAVVPGSAFGAEGHFRLSFSSPIDKLEEGIHRIKTALERLTIL
jgi:aspartate aminotransferase